MVPQSLDPAVGSFPRKVLLVYGPRQVDFDASHLAGYSLVRLRLQSVADILADLYLLPDTGRDPLKRAVEKGVVNIGRLRDLSVCDRK